MCMGINRVNATFGSRHIRAQASTFSSLAFRIVERCAYVPNLRSAREQSKVNDAACPAASAVSGHDGIRILSDLANQWDLVTGPAVGDARDFA